MGASRTNQLLRLLTIPALGAGLALSAQAQQGQPPAANSSARATATAAQPGQNYRAVRASKLIGMEVRNPQGTNIGKINDVIVDMTSGKVRYAMLEFDPGILQGERLFAVPTNELRMAGDRDQLVYNMTRERLERAGVERSTWGRDKRVSQQELQRFDSVYGVVAPSGGARALRVSDLIGKDVNSRAGEDIGDIDDVVIDMGGQRVHYVVLAFDPSWTSPERRFAFPLASFQLSADRDELMLDVDRAKIQAMKSFTEDRYGALNDPAWVSDIDRYFVTVLPTVVVGSGSGGDASSTFTRLDNNRDGVLSAAEAKNNAEIERSWKQLDANGDGSLSRDEFMRRNGGTAAAPKQ